MQIMSNITSISVEYKNVDGWHVFSSMDIAGLYVASPDQELAYNDVAFAIEKLLKLNMGIDCKVIPELSVSEFFRMQTEEESDIEIPTVVSSRRFAVACA